MSPKEMSNDRGRILPNVTFDLRDNWGGHYRAITNVIIPISLGSGRDIEDFY